jgi:hypothetical protein
VEADLREEAGLARARGWKQEELAGAVRDSAIGAGLAEWSSVPERITEGEEGGWSSRFVRLLINKSSLDFSNSRFKLELG